MRRVGFLLSPGVWGLCPGLNLKLGAYSMFSCGERGPGYDLFRMSDCDLIICPFIDATSLINFLPCI